MPRWLSVGEHNGACNHAVPGLEEWWEQRTPGSAWTFASLRPDLTLRRPRCPLCSPAAAIVSWNLAGRYADSKACHGCPSPWSIPSDRAFQRTHTTARKAGVVLASCIVLLCLVGGAMTTWYSGGTPARVNHRRTVVGGLPFLTCSAQRADPATLNSGSKSYKFVPSMARVP